MMNGMMVGDCCVCSERGWDANPVVYCDGLGCRVAVHQACYGIVTVPSGPWFCKKCEERAQRAKCQLCPSGDGALKKTDTQGWAHVVCALYIPELRFGNVITLEPILISLVPNDRFSRSCYICEESGQVANASVGACMSCNKRGCNKSFHVTCGQMVGILCEARNSIFDNIKYCGYCQYHCSQLKETSNMKIVPPFRPVPNSLIASLVRLNNGTTNQVITPREEMQPASQLVPGTSPITSIGTVGSQTSDSAVSVSGAKKQNTDDIEVVPIVPDKNQLLSDFKGLLTHYEMEKAAMLKKIKEKDDTLQRLQNQNEIFQKLIQTKDELRRRDQLTQSKLEKELAEAMEAKKKLEEELTNMKKSMKEKEAVDEAKLELQAAFTRALFSGGLTKLNVTKEAENESELNFSISLPPGTTLHQLPSACSSSATDKIKRKSDTDAAEKRKNQKTTNL